MENRFVDSFDLKGALPKAEYMAEKSNNKNNSLETAYYTKLALVTVKMIEASVELGKRSGIVCLAEDDTLKNCVKISVKSLKKAYKYYSKQTIKHCNNHLEYRYKNNRHYDKLNYQERAIYRVLMDLIDKDYFISVFSSRTYEGDGKYYDFSYDIPYVTIVW